MAMAFIFLVWRCNAVGVGADWFSESVFGVWSRSESRARISALRECHRKELRDCRVSECWSYDPRE